MQSFPNRIKRLISEGYSFQFSEYISRGYDIMNKNVGLFIGFVVTWGVINFAIKMMDQALGSFGILDIIDSIIISPCLVIGFYMACKDTEDGQSLNFERFFDGFAHWKELVMVGLLQTVLIIIPAMLIGAFAFISTDLQADSFGNFTSNPAIIAITLVLVIVMLYFALSWQFAPMLVVFEKMKPWAALEASRQIISKNWFTFLGFAFVVGILMLIGAIALMIGLLYTVPAGLAMFYASYSDIVGFSDENEEMDIMDHFLDLDS